MLGKFDIHDADILFIIDNPIIVQTLSVLARLDYIIICHYTSESCFHLSRTAENNPEWRHVNRALWLN